MPSPSEVESLLYELCVDMGFCLPPEASAKLKADPPSDVMEFTRAVFGAEDIDPDLADRNLLRQMRDRVAQAFERSEWRALADRRARSDLGDEGDV